MKSFVFSAGCFFYGIFIGSIVFGSWFGEISPVGRVAVFASQAFIAILLLVVQLFTREDW